MVLLLPQEEGLQGYEAMVRAMSGARLRQVIDTGLRDTKVELYLPKFRLEHTIKDELIQVREIPSYVSGMQWLFT